MTIVLVILASWLVLYVINGVTIRRTGNDGDGGCVTVIVLGMGVLVAVVYGLGT